MPAPSSKSLRGSVDQPLGITQKELGERIRAAREACGMTQGAVAKQLGICRPTIVKTEQGNRMVPSLVLAKMADLFGRDIRQLVGASFQQEDSLAALFRAQPDLASQPGAMKRLRECLALGRELTNLEALVGLDHDIVAAAKYSMQIPRGRWEAIRQGQRLAEDERRRLGLGSAPLPDLAGLLEAQGVRTGLVELPGDVSGLALSDRKAGLLVVANRAHPTLRRRFSLAHEYCHVVVDRERLGLVSRASGRDDLAEVRANAFAANFLVPEDGARQLVAGLGKGRPSRTHAKVFDEAGCLNVDGRIKFGSQVVQLYDVVMLAHHFEVSRLAALFRLRNLDVVDEDELERLEALERAGKGKRMAKLLGLAEADPAGGSDELRHRFLGLAVEAYRRGEVSRGKLRELASMVALPAGDLDKLVEDLWIDDLVSS
jgi:Zn-dependent peptidase ImmA (M78 family)/DNA-binding XRE family transcriptional regulator